MTEPDTFDPSLLKSLFTRLVNACGRQDAADARLGITRQRVSQLCSASPDHAKDIPTWGQVWALEQACERSVVFASLASMVEPGSSDATVSAVKETHDLVAAAAAMCPLALALAPRKPETVRAWTEGLDRVQREAADLTPIANVVSMRERG